MTNAPPMPLQSRRKTGKPLVFPSSLEGHWWGIRHCQLVPAATGRAAAAGAAAGDGAQGERGNDEGKEKLAHGSAFRGMRGRSSWPTTPGVPGASGVSE